MTRLVKSILCVSLAILAIAACPENVPAQGSRKDDVVFNAQGRPMAGAVVRVCASGATGQPCSPLASVFSDTALTQALANPLSADGLGNYTFYATPGRYLIEISGPGITTKQLPNVILPSDPSSPTFATVTTTSGISAFSLALAGDLTVNGSAAVVGSLSVGGAPVPSTNGDNQWAASQRFGGPIPWRDFTKYMPAGGCSSTNVNDPPATGTISASSTTLTLSSAADFKTGCGVAIMNAGPAATIAMASTSTGTTTRVGTLVTFTVTSGNPRLVPGIGSGSDFMGFVKVTGCSDANFNTTGTGWLLNSGTNPVTTFTYNTSGSLGTSATGCTATFYTGWAHGITGSTTWNYKVAPIDNKGGIGAAIGPIAITNGNASLTPQNYNWIGYQYTVGARMFAIYRDDGAGGAYSCINISYSTGFSDWGRALPFGCPAFVPSTPPASPTNQTLNTTITAGGGTTTLSLANAASSAATTKNVYHDESSFLASCINDVKADQVGIGTRVLGSYGCYIPYGRYHMNADMPTDTISAASGVSGGVSMKVAGTMVFQTWPWMIGADYQISGEGSSGAHAASQYFHTTEVERGQRMPAGVILRGSHINFENFKLGNMLGHAMMLSPDPSTTVSPAGINVNNVIAGAQDGFSTGVPLLIDSNTLFVNFSNMNFQPRSDGFPASILFTQTGYGGNGHTDINFNNIFTLWHHIVVDSPGGQNTGQGTNFTQNGSWWSEEHGQFPTGGLIALDTGTPGVPIGAPSTAARLAGAVITSMQNADASDKYLFSVLGNQTAQATISLYNSDQFTTKPRCDNGSTACGTGGVSLNIYTDSQQVGNGQTGPFVGPVTDGSYIVRRPLVTGFAYGQTGPGWSEELPAPRGMTVTGTGAGSLSANTYCFVVTGLDYQGTPAETYTSPEVCQAVGASGSIDLRWDLIYYANYYSNFRVYYGIGAGNEANYFVVAPVNSTIQTYTFSTTAGSTAGGPPAGGTVKARVSWLGPLSQNGSSCLLCTPFSTLSSQRLGVGDPNPPAGDKLSVKGGVLDAQSGFKSGLVTKSSNYTLTTADYWVNVTGTTTITVPHATTGNQWVVFNSGSNTVTIQADTGNINGGANITLSANTGKQITCDGTNCFAQ